MFLVLIIYSCTEGDVIENNINFTAQLESCDNPNENTFVFYKIDSGTNQGLSLQFSSTSFELNTIPNDLLFSIALNTSNNLLIYRQFDTSVVGSEYFCASVPPSGIGVAQELIANDGDVEIVYEIISDTTTETVYSRTITINNVTLEGNDIAIRQEVLDFGSDEITIPK